MSSIKTRSKQTLKVINNNDEKEIITSFSLPIWNKRRLSAITQKLKTQGFNVSKQEVITQVLQIIMTKLKREDNQPLLNRAVKYNQTSSAYETVPVRLTAIQYNSMHSKRITMKVSLSYLLDIALRLYLRFIMNLYLQKNKSIKTYISYYKDIIKFNLNQLLFTEKVDFYIKI